jgi:hypothetical protein
MCGDQYELLIMLFTHLLAIFGDCIINKYDLVKVSHLTIVVLFLDFS